MYEICRVCLTNDNLTSIFLDEGGILISQKIMSIASVFISLDDSLPHSICAMCVEKLHNSYKFKLDCEKSDIQLRAKLKQEHVEPKVEKKGSKTKKSIESHCSESKTKNKNRKFIENTETVCKDAREIERDVTDYCAAKKDPSDVDNKDELFIHKHPQLIEKSTNNESETKLDIKSQNQQCVTCGKVLSSRYRLKMHMRTHTGERPHCCEHCKKTFSLTSTLKIHMRVHTGEKPLCCPTCGKSFAHTAGLRAHARLHTGETPYCCALCPRSFRTRSHLHYHIRQHTGEKEFTCETCKKSFITENALKGHSRTHTAHKPHVCHVCGARFLRLYYLKRHMAIHSRPGTYACDQCRCTFSSELDLQEHKTEHAGPCQTVIDACSNSDQAIKGIKVEMRSKTSCQEESDAESFPNKQE